jgi:hypothetical protein
MCHSQLVLHIMMLELDELGHEICTTAKHAHNTTPFFVSHYREIGKIEV